MDMSYPPDGNPPSQSRRPDADPDAHADPDMGAYGAVARLQATSGSAIISLDIMRELAWFPPERRDRTALGRVDLIIGAVTGVLAVAVAVGVSTLAAAFVAPQASPVIAVGGAIGANDKTVPLLGTCVMSSVIAMVIGCLARRSTTVGVAGIAALGMFGAFAAITRPENHLADVVPSVIGGVVGIAAFLWLATAAAPVTPPNRDHTSSPEAS